MGEIHKRAWCESVLKYMRRILYFDTREELDIRLKQSIKNCDSLIDIGCGINPTDIVQPKNIHILLEPFEQYAKVLKKRTEKYTKSLIIREDALEFLGKLADNSIDSIVLFDVIEHIEYEIGLKVIEECKRVVKKQIIISTPLGFHEQVPGE